MTDKEQIQAMAKIISKACNGIKCSDCETSGNEVSACVDVKAAEVLYKAGYREASEVAREIFEEIEKSLCVHTSTAKTKEYAEGAFDTIEWVDSKIVELKNKYTEGKG